MSRNYVQICQPPCQMLISPNIKMWARFRLGKAGRKHSGNHRMRQVGTTCQGFILFNGFHHGCRSGSGRTPTIFLSGSDQFMGMFMCLGFFLNKLSKHYFYQLESFCLRLEKNWVLLIALGSRTGTGSGKIKNRIPIQIKWINCNHWLTVWLETTNIYEYKKHHFYMGSDRE